MRLNERVSGFGCDCGGWSVFDIFGSCLAGDFLFLLGGRANESDRDVAGALEDWAGGSLGPRLEAAEGGTGADDSFLDHERGRIEGEIVFRISDGGLQGLPDELCGFLGSEGQNIKSTRYGEALNFTGDVTRFFRRETYEFGGAFDFHGSSDCEWLLRGCLCFENGEIAGAWGFGDVVEVFDKGTTDALADVG